MSHYNHLSSVIAIARKYNYNLTHGLDIIPTHEEYSTMLEYLRKPTSKKLASDVRYLRDSLICGKPVGELIAVIERVLSYDKSGTVGRDAMDANNRHLCNDTLFHPHTRKLHAEHIRCCKGKALRNIDLHLENASVSHKVRRIVEKRMCQSVHRSFKGRAHSGRCSFMKRHAVQYELGTLGIIEDLQVKRDESTHWSRVYNHRLGRKVLKPKRGFSTIEKAQTALLHYLTCHVNDHRPMAVYRCDHCGQYHLGHNSPNDTVA